MSDKKDLAIIPALPSGVVSNLDVTKDDLIAVAVSKKEQALLAEKETAEKAVKEIEQEMNAVGEKRDKAVKAAAEAKWGPLVKNLNEALKALNVKCEQSLCRVGLEDRDGKLMIEADLPHFNPDLAMPAPAEVRSLCKEVEGLKKKLSETYEQVVEIRKQLAQLPALERRARAKWASAVIGQTAEGRKFLEQFEREV